MQVENSVTNLKGWETSSEHYKHSIVVENILSNSYNSSENMSHNSKDF